METPRAISAFLALGQVTRFDAFRALVGAAPEGLSVGEVAAALGPALEGLGGVRRRGGAPDGFRPHRLRQGRGRALPDLARAAGVGPLGVPDPVAATGNEAEKRLAFSETYRMLRNRIAAFASLPMASLDRMSLNREVDRIGEMSDAGETGQTPRPDAGAQPYSSASRCWARRPRVPRSWPPRCPRRTRGACGQTACHRRDPLCAPLHAGAGPWLAGPATSARDDCGRSDSAKARPGPPCWCGFKGLRTCPNCSTFPLAGSFP